MKKGDIYLPPYQVKKVDLTNLLKELSNWAFRSYRIKELWKHTKGEKVRVAILDTGCNHKDIKVKKFVNFTDDEDEDKCGHGTWVAGCIGAARGRFLGIAPECELHIAKILANDGTGNWDWFRKGLEWALEEECEIVNVSAGGDYEGEKIQPVLKKMANKGIIVVCAGGNERDLLIFPANDENSLAVGAVDKKWQRAKFSNFGPRLVVMAPGVELLGCWLNDGYAKVSGTSMAAPVMSGILTLEQAKHDLNLTEAIARFAFTSRDIGKEGWQPDTGWGIVEPHKFLQIEATSKKITWAWIINLVVFVMAYFVGDEENREKARRLSLGRRK
jgi:subtilisin